MNKTDATEILQKYVFDDEECIAQDMKDYNEALKMAISALQAEQKYVADLVKETINELLDSGNWRVAISNKHKPADRPTIVRCENCRWWEGGQETKHNNHLCKRALDQNVEYWTKADDFCSYGEMEE